MKLRKIVFPIIAAGSISVATPVVHPKPAQAAGFMQNTLANFTNSADIDPSIKNGINFLAAILYFVPVLVLVATVAGVAIASRAQSDDAVRTVVTIGVVVMALVGILWLYDSKMVGTTNSLLPNAPRWSQVALLNALANSKA